MGEAKEHFLGTYFDRDVVMRWSRIIEILSWVIAGIYAVDLLVGMTVMVLQYLRGLTVMLGLTDVLQQILWIVERPVHGILYFALLQALSKGLLIALDMEENTRRASRNQ
jgi:hypothetical protein